jgi:hypothetical protein
MSKAALAAVVGLALGAAGCGTVCTRIGAATEGLNRKAGDCSNQSTETFDVAACDKGLDKCSPDDVDQLGSYAQCLDNVSSCLPGQEMSFGLAKLGCLSPLSKVSYTCLSAMK